MAGFPKVRMAYSVPPKDADPRESAIYSLAEAALFLGVPRTTLKDWTEPHFYKKLGNTDSLIAPVGYATDLETGKDVAWLSFYNLSEAHVLFADRQRADEGQQSHGRTPISPIVATQSRRGGGVRCNTSL